MSDNASKKSAASMVYVTCGSMEQARAIGRAVVEEELAACANIIDDMRSIYRWEGMVEEGREVVLIFKTRRALVPELEARVKALHSFEVPCIVEIPLERGNADYFAWILEETGGSAG